MSNEKPKLTEEQFNIIWNICSQGKPAARERFIELGYMEKPETALERAERLFSEWGKEPSKDEKEENKINEIINAYREAIKELTDTINKIYAEERHEA